MNTGTTHSGMKAHNLGLVLQQIATGHATSRIDIAHSTGLTKATITNLVGDLVARGIVCEEAPPAEAPVPAAEAAPEPSASGRPPVALAIAPGAPLVCGVFLRRGTLAVVLGTLAGEICDREVTRYEGRLSPARLTGALQEAYAALTARCPQPILAVGISAPGLVDTAAGTLLNPPGFFDRDCELPLADFVRAHLHPEVYLMHDTSAGALAEKHYGHAAPRGGSFVFLSLVRGIGAGLVLNGQVYDGLHGQAGELGHTPFEPGGPPCACGGRGCLEGYAGLEAMTATFERLALLAPGHPLAGTPRPSFGDFVGLAQAGDLICRLVLQEYVEPLSVALAGLVNLLDIGTLVVDHEGEGDILLELLGQALDARLPSARRGAVQLRRASLGPDAPLVGAVAVVAAQVFAGRLPV